MSNAHTVAGNPDSARRAVLIHSLAMDPLALA